MSKNARPRRSILYMPGSNARALEKGRTLAADGLIHSGRNGAFQVFISDDLHTPPLRAVKYRDERLARLKGWKDHVDGMHSICQCRTEVGQDPEVADAMQTANIKMHMKPDAYTKIKMH